MIDQPDIIYTILKMLGALIALSWGLYVCLRFIKRLLHVGIFPKADPLIRVIDVCSIGIKKQIALVEVPGSVLVVGMAGDRIELLDKIVDVEIRQQITAKRVSIGMVHRTYSD